MSTLQITTARRHVSKTRVKALLKFYGLVLLFSPVITYHASRIALTKVWPHKPVDRAINAVRKAYYKLYNWGYNVVDSIDEELHRAEVGLVTAKKEYYNECLAALDQVQSQEYMNSAIASATHEAKSAVQRDIESAKLRLRQALDL